MVKRELKILRTGPGVNLIQFLHVYFTSVAIVLETENNS